MNNACPTCGAVYAVATKDIGRKIKCKKCGTALLVDDSGLVIDAPVAVVAPAATRDEDFDTGDDAAIARKKSKKYSERGPGINFGAFFAKVGGIPTILFTIGLFLVIWFTFMPLVGEAATLRASESKSQLQLDMNNKLKALLPKGKRQEELSGDDLKQYLDKAKPIQEEYAKKLSEADEDAAASRVTNIRDIYWERLGTLFGFLFLAFGCLGYLRTDQTLILRIVAAVVLTFILMVIFLQFGGGCSSPRIPLGVKG